NGSADSEQYLGDVKFSTEDWFDNLEIMAHASYLRADFQASVQAFPNNTLARIGSDGNITNPLNITSPLVLLPDGFNANLGRLEQVPSIELSGLYKGFTDHLLRVGGGFRYEEITTNESKNVGTGVINPTQLLPPPAINVIDGTLTTTTGTRDVYLPDTSRNILSAFVQDEWQITKDWQLTAGVRYDNYSDFGNTVNPRAALVWNVNEQFTTKLLYGKAFRAPSFTEQFQQNNPSQQGNPALKPEKINTFEWAADFRPLPTLRTAANLYYYQIKDLIGVAPDPGKPTRSFQNVGDQDGYGGEFEWNWQVTEQVSVMGNYAWVHARNEQTHQQVTGIPEQHVYFATQWQFMPGWQIQPQINWIGGRTTPALDNRPLDDYETIDITLRGKKLFGHLNVAASLRNMFDATYREPAAVSAIQLPQNLPMQGRSFYLEASVNF
ncbi:MAG: TonB-dependent receptor, partial [Methylococcaceae bacterium]